MTFLFVQCNSGEKDEAGGKEGEETAQTVDLGNVDEIDLEEYGFQIVINVPAASPTTPEPTIDVLDWGAIEVRVGTSFQIQVSASEGDVAQKKSDIQNLYDDIYETSFMIDQDNALFYSSTIPGLEPEYHLFVVISDGGKAFEVEDIRGESYSEEEAKRMFDFAKAIKIKPSI
jgi:hypothetical protein